MINSDVILDTTDLDIGLIDGENFTDVIIIVVNKRLYADGNCFYSSWQPVGEIWIFCKGLSKPVLFSLEKAPDLHA